MSLGLRVGSSVAVGVVAALLAATALSAQRPQAKSSSPPAAEPLKFVAVLWHDAPNDLSALAGIRSALELAGRQFRLETVHLKSSRELAKRELSRLDTSSNTAIFALGTEAALLAKEFVRKLPVVFTAVTHPVESGVVPAWSGSGSNLAGNSNWIPAATMLRVFGQAVPKLSHLGMLRSAATGRVSGAEQSSVERYLQQHSEALELSVVVIQSPTELRSAIDKLVAGGAEAIWVPIDFSIYQRMDTVLERARHHGVPVLSSSLKGALAGAVAGLLVNYRRMGQRAAALALQIVDGRAPAAMKVEQMHGYQVVVNLVAAKQCGYELPLSLLAVADRLIDPAANARGRSEPREKPK